MSNFGKFPLLPVWTKIISHHSVTELHGTINLLRETQQRLHKKKKYFPFWFWNQIVAEEKVNHLYTLHNI